MINDPEDQLAEESLAALNDDTLSELLEESQTSLESEPETKPAEEDWKGKYFRALAEQENMRKRLQKEKQDMLRFCYENCISEFLAPLDNLENALKFTEQASPEVKNWAMGFHMISTQFKEILHNHGVVAFHSEGNIFDPHSHEAVEILETEQHAEGIILQEFTKGYKSASRVVRPARVKVAKRPKAETSCKEHESQAEQTSKETTN